MKEKARVREKGRERANSLRDKISELNAVERKGIEKGLKKGREEGKKEEKIAIAKNLLDILDNETIALKTGLTISDVENLRKL